MSAAGPGAEGRAASGTDGRLAAAAAQLYGLLPEEFTAARNARAKEARQAGDGELAEALKELPKPSTAAWVVNTMVTQRRDELDQFLDLGEALREAQDQLDADQLRQLNRQRHQLLAALVRESRAVAAKAGHRVSDAVANEVEQTLRAAMADTAAAAAVRTGQLVRSLPADGAGDGGRAGGLAAAVAVPAALNESNGADREAGRQAASKARRASAASDRAVSQAEREQRERRRAKVLAEALDEAAAAEAAATSAQTALDGIGARIVEVQQRRGELEQRVKELRDRLADAEQQVAAAQWEARGLERDKDKASRAAGEARRRAERARDQADRLQEDGRG
ncbi:MAG TPA: hypothetical protein VGN49_02795 [Micrococcaceae bacterium]|nr:hypothetical protein [Micrococcaceae bacterium]